MAPAAAPYALYALLAVCLPICLVTDVRTRTIYDVVTLPTLGLALLLRLVLDGWNGPFGLAQGVVGAAIGGGLFGVMFRLGGMGMGDVKLMAAIGAALGFPAVLTALVCIALAGGLQALLAMVWSGTFVRTLRNTGLVLLRGLRLTDREIPAGERQRVPYGVAIVAGTVWAIGWQPWIGAGLGPR